MKVISAQGEDWPETGGGMEQEKQELEIEKRTRQG
jgi:hypothetical protein